MASYNVQLGGGAPGVSIERRAWFKPNLESRWNMMPALIGALSMLQTLPQVEATRKRFYGDDKTPYMPPKEPPRF